MHNLLAVTVYRTREHRKEKNILLGWSLLLKLLGMK